MNVQSGTPVIVDPAAVHAVAANQSGAAEAVRARTAAERSGTSTLVPTFGLIGVEFLAALERLGAARADRLDALASRHASAADCASTARTAYQCCDGTNADAVAGVPA
ncbi:MULTISPECIES: type VII secretion target [Gordonia]|uniref:ESX-1 secretion-associated protein n=2 Tax=Gordonia TaxID=2053 RepID=L7LM65_9ACTN|nr:MULTISPECIES: type VII secretion target [Gordonia]AUH69562.1 ESX-1 secretion-associated protein [Gordonia sp. YC-JH1]MBY4569444.1 ESX-1 secretion-associated protein [Gordonia sihwensis]GAC61128.1 hypothetical protein GSI01S_14_01460 [Gordonia sihwensis NBRC 108236]